MARDQMARRRADAARAKKPAEPEAIERDWYTQEETMQRLGIAERTLREWCQLGRIAFRTAQNAGKRPRRLYKKSDVDKLAEIGLATPNAKESKPGGAIEPRRPHRGPDVVSILAQLLVEMKKEPPALPAPAAPPPLWITIDEAHELTRMSKAYLIKLCQDGKVKAVKAPGWLIRRRSLEEYDG